MNREGRTGGEAGSKSGGPHEPADFEGYYEAVVRQIPVAFIVTDLDRRIRVFSLGAERLLGYAAAEILGRPLSQLFPEEMVAMEDREIRRAAEEERVVSYSSKRIAKDGRILPVEVFRAPVRDRAGRLAGHASILLDQTEKLSMQEQLLQAERLNALARVVGKVFHELRTPLGVLVLHSEILSEEIDELIGSAGDRADPVLVHRVRETLTLFAREIQRIEGLAEDYLLMIRPIRPHPSRMTVGEFLENVKTELLSMTGRPPFEVRVECEASQRRRIVQIDPLQMLRVFINLAGNSLDAAGEDTEPVLSIRARFLDDRRVEIRMRDNGPGLPPSLQQGGAFEMFSTTKSRGSGLGLHLVQEIVLAHGGTIELANHPEGGAEARIVLPAAEAGSEA
ncbi:MAG: nitrogen regulation protein NR(II) [Candidatus Eisenbacteria bacterium]|nr:PAS domain S-box protein [Candidatus Eisenbacteria bacterium]